MSLFNQDSPGILGRASQWMTPDRASAFQAVGMGLSQLGAGQPVNLSPAYEALQQRQMRSQQQQMLEQSGVMQRFTPDQRAILAQMEPSAAQRIIAEALFAPPEQAPAPISINGQLVDPRTMEVVGDYRDPQAPQQRVSLVGPGDPSRATWGLPDDGNTYQIEHDDTGQFLGAKRLDGSPLVNVDMGQQGPQVGTIPPGYALVADPSDPSGYRMELISGGPAQQEAQERAIVSQSAFDNAQAAIDQARAIRNDPALPSITGNIQGRMKAGLPLLSGGQDGTDLNVRIEQLKGTVFLQAYETLKGGGPITDLEGQQATNALARLDRAQSVEAYQAALDDFIDAVERGMAKLQVGAPSGADQLSQDDRAYLGLN